MKDNTLNLFFGRQPDENFSEDLETLKKLPEAEVLELIEKIIKWYPEKDIGKEWDEWAKEFTKDKEKEIKGALRIFVFIFKEFISKNVSDLELKEDLEIFEFPQKYIDRFTELVKSVEKEFRKKSLRTEKPYENTLINLDWRIDTKHYRDGEEKKVAVIELILSDKGEKEIVQFDLNKKSLKHLIYRLQKIGEELCQ